MYDIHGTDILHAPHVGHIGAVVRPVQSYDEVDVRPALDAAAGPDIPAALLLLKHVVGSDIVHIYKLAQIEASGRKLGLGLAHGIADKVGHGDLLGHSSIDGEHDPATFLDTGAGSGILLEFDVKSKRIHETDAEATWKYSWEVLEDDDQEQMVLPWEDEDDGKGL